MPETSPSAVAAPAESTRADPQPRRLLLSIFGLFVRDETSWISVAALIRLLSDLGVGGQAVRSSISRLKRRGSLVASREDGTAGYSPSESLQRALVEGDHRIFGRSRATLEDGWVTVVFSVPEDERKKRHELRSALAGHGFGIMAPGVWIAPGTVAEETPDMLRRRGLEQYATVLRGSLLGGGGPDETLAARVAQWWDLPELAAGYQQFVTAYDELRARLDSAPLADAGAFAAYVPMVTAWRRLPYLDPGLPLALLPSPWPGARATELFHELHRRLAPPAHRYASVIIAGTDSPSE